MARLNQAAEAADLTIDLNLRILKLERRLERERAARLQAESIAENGLRDLYNNQQQLVLLEAVATKVNHSETVEECFRFAVEAICGHTGWPVGNVYMRADDDAKRLLPTRFWHVADAESFADFLSESLQVEFRSGMGLGGRVLETGAASWIVDVTQDANFPRANAASACGLRSAFAFPVLVRDDVMAVVEFFSRETLEPDDQLLTLMAQIGTQLGRVIERKHAEEKLIHDATHDPLTALPNRLLFMDRLERAVAEHGRMPDRGYAVLFIDLDRFKLVNDSLGHAAGDHLLTTIASRLGAALVEAEEPGNLGIFTTLARLGGDEFTVLLDGLSHSGVAVDIAERLLAELRLPISIEGQDIYSSASIGVASSDTGYANAADIMRDADLAMYGAKTDGRGRIEVFDKALHEIAKWRLSLESDLRRALINKELVLHYQPIVALETERLTGFEALVRWQRNSGELVPPSDFIGIAEETGLIVHIGNWVMREAFMTLAEWQKTHRDDKPLTMSVNVSPRQFHQPDFVEQVIEAVTASGAKPETIRLEITEGVTIQDAERTVGILQSLRSFGVRVSIDDFGTGYSSLSYLHKLPFDTLKIDRSFISALQTQTQGREIVRTILDLAKNLHMDVIAEGTETKAHVDLLRQMGCRSAQGYYFSKPLDRAAATKLIS